MFCRLTYFCIQFIQRTTPPLSINYKTKPIRLRLLYKKSGRVSTKNNKSNIIKLKVNS